MAIKDNKVQLPNEVAEKYELVNWQGSHRQKFGSAFGIVDVSTLTLDQAERLVKRGFSKLRAKALDKGSANTTENAQGNKGNKNKP